MNKDSDLSTIGNVIFDFVTDVIIFTIMAGVWIISKAKNRITF